jgi:hypothetical protein
MYHTIQYVPVSESTLRQFRIALALLRIRNRLLKAKEIKCA